MVLVTQEEKQDIGSICGTSKCMPIIIPIQVETVVGGYGHCGRPVAISGGTKPGAPLCSDSKTPKLSQIMPKIMPWNKDCPYQGRPKKRKGNYYCLCTNPKEQDPRDYKH